MTMRLLLALCALTLALPASAGSYTITTTAGQDAKLSRAVARANKQTCQSLGLAAGCTRAQARDAWCRRLAAKPAPCTVGARSSAEIDIYGALPSQATHSGKYLYTDGLTASWAAVNSLPSQTGNGYRLLTTNGTSASWTSGLYVTGPTLTPSADNNGSLGAASLRWANMSIAGIFHFGAQTPYGTLGVDVAYGEPGTLYVGRAATTAIETGAAIKTGNITLVPVANPGSLTITQTYTPGSTTVTYAVAAKFPDGSHSAATYGTTTTPRVRPPPTRLGLSLPRGTSALPWASSPIPPRWRWQTG